jgi:predicted acylesterase/phospholipase RssA
MGPRDPNRYCDIVMKGGITSGVVYPLAAVELAEHYRFRNIGGTSAGAIAAAAVAAAECGRRSGSNEDAYESLAGLPDELGQDLLSLFQPSWWMRPFFRALLAASGGGKLAKLAAPLDGFPIAALIGAVPGAALIALAVLLHGDAGLRVAAGVAGLFLLPAFILLAIGISAWVRLRRLPRHYYGICPGNDPGATSTQAPLTRWLAELLDDLAGKTGSAPLTFGDLWRLEGPDKGEPGILLQMITTCLTQGRPYSIPFKDDEAAFWFAENEFRDLFPAKVVEHMVSRSCEGATSSDGVQLKRLPKAEDLPVVVAARMSLSFPLLIAAVPLYAHNARDGASPHPERCWFSDGGITSNMPIHFFDSPVPRWPTFAIDLQALPPGVGPSKVEGEDVWLPTDNDDGIAEAWIGAADEPGLGRSLKFFASIFRTAQNWVDNRQMKGIGYRDRIAHVRLAEDEGGMNLNMDATKIKRLGERGARAAATLAERFGPGPPDDVTLTWDNQRWLRFRAFLELLERRGELAWRGYTAEGTGTPMGELNERPAATPPEYAWADGAQSAFAVPASEDLVATFEDWEAGAPSFDEGMPPGPRSETWLIPRI